MQPSLWVLLWAIFNGLFDEHGTDAVDIVVLKVDNLQYCIVPEQYTANKILVIRFGNCCSHKRMVFNSTTKTIRTESTNGDLCLVKAPSTLPLPIDVNITPISTGNCAKFTYPSPIDTTSILGHQFQLKDKKLQFFLKVEAGEGGEVVEGNSASPGEFAVMKCDPPTVTSSDLKLSFKKPQQEHCWIPKGANFADGNKLAAPNGYSTCCSIGTFQFKSDKTLWMKESGSRQLWCVYVDGISNAKKFSDLDNKPVKINSAVNSDCNGTAFEHDATAGLLKVLGTDRCVIRTSTNQDLVVNTCVTTDSHKYKTSTCSTQEPASTSSTRTTSSLASSSRLSTLAVDRSSSVVAAKRRVVTSSLIRSSLIRSSTVLTPKPTQFMTFMTSSSSKPTPPLSSKSTLAMTSSSSELTPPLSSKSTLATTSSSTFSFYWPREGSTLDVKPSMTIVSRRFTPMTSSMCPLNSAAVTLPENTTKPVSSTILATVTNPVKRLSTSITTPSPTKSTPAPSPKTEKEEIPFEQVFKGTPVNGQYGNWTRWSKCSVECGTGIQKRIRYCDSPAPRNGGKHCSGKSEEEAQCIKPKCSGRSLAGEGENCDVYCKRQGLTCSTRIDFGDCNQDFIKSGVNCSSNENGKVQSKPFHPSYVVKTEECNGYIISDGSLFSCNASAPSGTRRLCNCITEGDQGYGEWVPWSSCSLTCGGGTRRRTRNCNSANPSEMKCIGNSTEVEQCNTRKCPIDGGFSDWSQWSSCSKSCDGGVRDRNRTCSNPYPEYGGAICYGYYKESRSCGNGFCPVDGGWTTWTEWHHCDKPCNTGKISRERWCENPTPMYGGRPCQGYNNESALCNTEICPNTSLVLTDVAFDEAWLPGLQNENETAFYNFSQKIDSNVGVALDSQLEKTYAKCWLHSLRKGSVVGSFTLYFSALDSFQSLLLMDAINVDHFLGKMPIVQSSVANFSSKSVPSTPPTNVTASVHNITTIIVSWNEVPAAYRNGVITGYIVFYKEAASPDYTSIGTNKTSETILGLHPATEYLIRVLAYTPNGNGIASEMIRIFTQEKAPTLPPTQVSTTTLSSTMIFLEWNHPPVSSWNGVLRGYRIKLLNSKSTIIKIQTVAQDARFKSIDSLTPGTTYLIDICPFTKAGVGPCFRTSNMTFVRAPSVAPGNLTGSNKTSVDSIDVTFGTIPLKYIHGYLKGYKIEYRVHRIGLAYDQDEVTQSVMVGPFVHKATLKSMISNAVYAIRVMAVNQHGDGVKSPIVYAETCTCPSVIYTNYALMTPYIFRDKNGNMKGIFMNLLENSTRNICGLCKGKPSTVDYVNDGKNGWASKANLVQVTKGVDDYTHVSFVISGRTELASYLGRPYVAAVDHPGMILFIPKETVAEQVSRSLNLLWNLWPIFVINLAFICLAGIIYFCLTARETPQTESCCFGKGAIAGMYWAYVTMFTHGYGDIVPSAVIPRTFAIMWILVGLVTSAILMGAITSVLTTASVLGEAKVYGKQLAAVEGSKEQMVGIYRNAKVNTKKKYKTVDEVYRALKNREVYAGLVDSYVAANRPDLFSDSAIIARKMIKYPYTYGFVLSDSMRNADSNLRHYFTENSNYISQMVEDTTQKFKVNVDAGGAVSLFDPKSPVLRKNLIILSVITVVVFIIGCLYSLFKNKYRKCKVVTHGCQSAFLDECEALCEEFFTDVEEFSVKMDKLYEYQIERILKLQTLRKKYPQRKDSIRVTRMNLSSPDVTYLANDARTGDVIVKSYDNPAIEGDVVKEVEC